MMYLLKLLADVTNFIFTICMALMIFHLLTSTLKYRQIPLKELSDLTFVRNSLNDPHFIETLFYIISSDSLWYFINHLSSYAHSARENEILPSSIPNRLRYLFECLSNQPSPYALLYDQNNILISPMSYLHPCNFEDSANLMLQSRLLSVLIQTDDSVTLIFNDDLNAFAHSTIPFDGLRSLIFVLSITILIENPHPIIFYPFVNVNFLLCYFMFIIGKVSTLMQFDLPLGPITKCYWHPNLLGLQQDLIDSRQILAPHVSHVLTHLIPNSIWQFMTDEPEIGRNILQSELTIHRSFFAPQFYLNTSARRQFFATLTLPLSEIILTFPRVISNFTSDLTPLTATAPVPNSCLDLFLRLPYELRTKVILNYILRPLCLCECQKYFCKKQTRHNQRCRRSVSSHFFRLPRIFPIQTRLYTNSLSNTIHIGINIILTVEENNQDGFPDFWQFPYQRYSDRKFTILQRHHLQIDADTSDSEFHSQANPQMNLSRTNSLTSTYESHPLLSYCPSDLTGLIPRSPRLKDHTILLD